MAMNMRKWCTVLFAMFSFIMLHACGVKTEHTKLEKQEKTLTIYVSDDELTTIKSYKKSISFTSEDEKYKATIQALQSSPPDHHISLWKDIAFRSLTMNQGTFTLDIHIPDEARLGAGGEQLALDTLEQTLFQFDEIKSIIILVDGKKVESLMGHVTLEYPLQRP